MSQIPHYFIEALKMKIFEDFGTQAEFCRRCSIEAPRLNDIIKGRRNLTFDSMEKYAKAAGSTAYDLIEIGKTLVDGSSDQTDNNDTLIDGYDNKSVAIQINKKLTKIESIEPSRLKEFNAFCDVVLFNIAADNNEHFEGGIDRRSGGERRKHVLGL
jgi:transcriptional regulator with XRE-family HTH domain